LTASTPQELREIIDEYGNDSHILIDTPGVNHFDEDALSGLKEYLDEIPDLETHLVVSAVSRYIDIVNIAKKFNVFPVHRLLFTRADETDLYGTLYSVTEETQIPISYITDGQEVPNDIRQATAEMVAEMVMRK
jgi:flagellar biosynthesis protein FlhF